MKNFWPLARRMARHRVALVGAIVAAAVSAVSLGSGLVAIGPVLEALIGEGRTLPDMARSFNAASPIDLPGWLVTALPADPFAATAVVVCGLVGLTLIGAAANYAHMALSLTVVERTVARVRWQLFDATVRLPLWGVLGRGAPDSVSRVVNDPQALGAGLSALLSKGVAQVTKGAASFGAALFISWRLTAITLVVVPVMAVVIRKLGKRIRRSSRRALERQAALYGVTTEAVQGLRVVKLYGAERRESARFHRENKAVLGHVLRARTARALSGPLLETLSIMVLAVLALVAVKAVQDGEIGAPELFTTLAALGVSGASLRPLSGIVNDIQQSSAAADRIAQTLAQPPEPGRDRGLPPPPPLEREIAFERVSLTYPGASEPAVKSLTLRIPRGRTVALVGPNGSGKTTLLSLVPRLLDPDPDGVGRVSIDGVDLRGVNVRALRRMIAAVTQETVLFDGTIAENIAYGSRHATAGDIQRAASRARAHEFIEARGGYSARVGDRGLALSGGQRQRIAIARAILRDPAILLLDEATSMIDAPSEAQITEAIAELSAGRTTIVVAHRLSTVMAADTIAVMDRGELVDQGTHGELLERCGLYRSLARHQLAGAGA